MTGRGRWKCQKINSRRFFASSLSFKKDEKCFVIFKSSRYEGELFSADENNFQHPYFLEFKILNNLDDIKFKWPNRSFSFSWYECEIVNSIPLWEMPNNFCEDSSMKLFEEYSHCLDDPYGKMGVLTYRRIYGESTDHPYTEIITSYGHEFVCNYRLKKEDVSILEYF